MPVWSRLALAFATWATSVALAAPASGPAPAVVPVEVRDGVATARARVGERVLRAQFDTAGRGTVGIRAEALGGLEVRYTGEFVERTDGAGRRFRGRAFVIPAFTLGDTVWHDVPGYERLEASGGPFGAGGGYDLVVGREFLERFALVVDYPHGRIELRPPSDGTRACGSAGTPLVRLRAGFWGSEVETDQGSLILVWDTGADRSFVQGAVAAGRGWRSRGGAFPSGRFTVGDRDLGPVEFAPLAVGAGLDADGGIGGDVFARARVCLDPVHGRAAAGERGAR
jgi:hypothetical protein